MGGGEGGIQQSLLTQKFLYFSIKTYDIKIELKRDSKSRHATQHIKLKLRSSFR